MESLFFLLFLGVILLLKNAFEYWGEINDKKDRKDKEIRKKTIISSFESAIKCKNIQRINSTLDVMILSPDIYGYELNKCMEYTILNSKLHYFELLINKIKPSAERINILFWYSTKYSKIKIAKYLLEHGADIDSLDFIHRTALSQACLDNNYSIINFLIEHGANLNLALGDIIETNNLKLLEKFTEVGCNLNYKSKHGEIPFYLACKYGNLDIVNFLYEKNVDIFSKNKNGLSALHAAIRTKNIKLIEFLILADFDINECDDKMNTPLHYASRESGGRAS